LCLGPVGVNESIDLIRTPRFGLREVPDHISLPRSSIEVHACGVVCQVSYYRDGWAFVAGVGVEWVAAILAGEPRRGWTGGGRRGVRSHSDRIRLSLR